MLGIARAAVEGQEKSQKHQLLLADLMAEAVRFELTIGY